VSFQNAEDYTVRLPSLKSFTYVQPHEQSSYGIEKVTKNKNHSLIAHF